MPQFTNLDNDLLRTVVTIAETGSFTRAADRLFRTQSTISLQVKRLEDLLGRKIFERDARSLKLTADGEVLIGYARRILHLNDEAVSRLTEPELEGEVRLGTPEDFATTHLPDVLASFAKSHPRVALSVRCDLTINLLAAFEVGEFDMVLLKRDPRGPSIGTQVWREPLVWAASAAATFKPDEPLPLVLSPQPCVYRKRAIEALEDRGRRWRVSYTSPSLAGSLAAVIAGLGVTVLPKEMLPAKLNMLGEHEGFPQLEDTEIALSVAPQASSVPVRRLAEHIVRSLEHREIIPVPV